MNQIIFDKRNFTINNRTSPISKSKSKKIYIYHPLPSEQNKNKRLHNKINNLNISNSITIFSLSKNLINLKSLKKARSQLRNAHFSSSPNINKYDSSTNNKNTLLKYHSFNYKYKKQKPSIDLSLYAILALNKNKIIKRYDKDILNKKEEKINNLKCLTNKGHLNLFNESNKNNNFINPKKNYNPIYLSCLNNNFINSEKVRFYNMMERLNKIKMLIEENPNNKYEVIKKFFINIGLDNKNYLSKNKMNIFLKFIKNDFIVDPSKSFKDNIINIIKNNKDYLLLKNSLKNYGYMTSSPTKGLTQRIKNIIQINNNFYKCKNLKFNTFDKFKIKRFDLDLKLNLNKQNEVNKINNRKEVIDIIKEPQKIMNNLEDKLKEENNFKLENKKYDDWRMNIILKNYSDYNYVQSYDLDKLKRRNLLTEYACFKKAKSIYDLRQMKAKYNI